MERFWRWLGVALGKHWKFVAAGVVVITILLGFGARNIDFATGQDSYLNPDSQIAIDNVAFQDDFGGETVILLFTSTDGSDVSKLYEGANLEELTRITDELHEVDGADAVITPLTSLTFSANLLSGGVSSVGSSALLSAASRDEAGAEARQADIATALARLGEIPEDDRVIGNPAYNELLIYDNGGFTVEDGTVVPPPDAERRIRLSLASTFPNVEGGIVNGTAVGGVVLEGNADLDTQTAGTKQVIDILDDAQFEGFDLTVTGAPVYLADLNDYLQGGMLSLGAAALVLMAIVLLVMFRVRWRLLPLLAVIIGVLWSFSILGMIGISLSLVTISGLPILIGMGIDFAIQIHNRVEEEVVLDKEAHPISETVANLAPPLFAAAVTAVVAFVALRISKVPMIRDFGVLLAIGIMVLVIVGIVVPASALGIREYKKRTEVRPESIVEKIVVKLGSLPTSWGLGLLIASALLFFGGVLVEDRAKIESDPIKWVDQSSQVVKDIGQLEEETGFSSTLGVLVAANNIYDQDVIDLVWEFTLDAEERGDVVSTSSLVNTMGKIIKIDGATPISPTSADVAASVAQMPEDIQKALLRAPDDPTGTQLNLRLAPASLEERAVLVRELEADLQARIDALDLPADSVLLVDLPEGQDPVRATPAGLATVGIGLLENLSANRANLTYLALCLAALFLVLRCRSLTRGLLALVPVLLAVGVSSLIVGLLEVRLSPLTTVSGPLVIATCAEFSVLILGRYLEERQRGLDPEVAAEHAARRTGRAFFTSAVATICGFAVLIGSALPAAAGFRHPRDAQRCDRRAGRARRDSAGVDLGGQAGLARHPAAFCRPARLGAPGGAVPGAADRRCGDRRRRLRRRRGGRVRDGGHQHRYGEHRRVHRHAAADHDDHDPADDGAAADGARRLRARGSVRQPRRLPERTTDGLARGHAVRPPRHAGHSRQPGELCDPDARRATRPGEPRHRRCARWQRRRDRAGLSGLGDVWHRPGHGRRGAGDPRRRLSPRSQHVETRGLTPRLNVRFPVVETGVDPVTPRFSGVCSAN